MGSIFRNANQVSGFVRIGFQVEQLQVAGLRVGNQLPPLVPNGALNFEEWQKYGVPNAIFFTLPDRTQAFTFETAGWFYGEYVAQSRKQINQVGKCAGRFSTRNPWPRQASVSARGLTPLVKRLT
jgi:hypothetical protein